MFKKISRGINHASAGKKGSKYKIDILVEKLDNLPAAVKKCRVVWSRGPKVQMTEVRDVVKGSIAFKQQLTQIATMYQDANDDFEAKDYKFQIQVPSKEGDNKLMTVGKADLDLSLFVLNEGQPQNKLIPILFKVGAATTGYLKVIITVEAVTGSVDDDGMTEVSALTGMTTHLEEEQDLSGFEDDDEQEQSRSSGKPSPTAQNSASKRPASRLRASTPPPAAVGEPSKQHESASSSHNKPAAAATDGPEDDGDISPMTMSPEGSPVASREPSRTGTRDPGKQSTVVAKAAADGKADKDARAELFSSGPRKSSAGTVSAASAPAVSRRGVQDLTDDEARSELFVAGASKPGKGISAPQNSSVAARTGAKTTSVVNRSSTAAAAAAVASSDGMNSDGSTRTPSMLSDASAGSVGINTSAASGGAGRRNLLSRRQSATNQQPETAASAAKDQPSSRQEGSRSATASAAPSSKHMLSDDEDAEMQVNGTTSLLKPLASRSGASSKVPGTSGTDRAQQQTPASLNEAAGASSTAVNEGAGIKQYAAEIERLQAQLAALRNQAVQAEDARRQARLAAENAAAERDDYKAQVQELQHQLQEVISTTVSADEAQESEKQVQALQQQVQDLHIQLQHKTEELTSSFNKMAGLQSQPQCDADGLKQQLAASESYVQEMQQHLAAVHIEAVEQLTNIQQQLSEQQPSAAQLTEMHGLLHDVLHILRQRSAADATDCPPRSVHAGDKETADLRAKVVEQGHMLSKIQQQRDGIMAMLLSAAHVAAQAESVKQFIWDQGITSAVEEAVAAADLEPEAHLKEEVQQVLICLKAAAAAAVQSSECTARLQDRLASAATHVYPDKLAACALQHVAVATIESISGNNIDQLQPVAKPGSISIQRNNSHHLSQQQDEGTQSQYTPVADSDDALIQVTQQLAKTQRKVQDLTKKRDKLEIVLQDFEASAAEERQQLLVQLSAANQQLRQVTQQLEQATGQIAEVTAVRQQLERQLQTAEVALAAAQLAAVKATEEQHQLQAASDEAHAATAAVGLKNNICTSGAVSPQVIALADSAAANPGLQNALSAAQGQVAELQKQLAEHEISKKALDREVARLRKQLADEQAERTTLEEQLAQHLEDAGDYTAQDTVAAYEAKYNRLKTRFRELTANHQDEVSGLHEEIAALQDKLTTSEAAAAQLEAARSQAQHGEATLADALVKSSKASAELALLQADNEQLMQSLVSAKLQLAQVSEREVISKRELYKAKETNMKLASKMTKLETLVYK